MRFLLIPKAFRYFFFSPPHNINKVLQQVTATSTTRNEHIV